MSKDILRFSEVFLSVRTVTVLLALLYGNNPF